ncbi:MAG: hypothetical protein HKN32_00925 [Flavobacteriales bacterium]|nr:hypothetical protein [Flavobacteriales bacterium]
MNDVELYPNNAGKDKLKTNEQYVAILHANLFQTALSANEIFEINNCIESIGDKELAREVIISNFMNKDGVQIPTIEEMNLDIDAFIEDTFVRFYVRFPSEAERLYVRNFIESNPFMTPELVYFSFALSNEYMYY